MIVYNLWKYLEDLYPTTNYVTDAFQGEASDEATLLNESGGIPSKYDLRQEINIQVMSRSFEKAKAKKENNKFYLALKNKYRIELPEATVEGETYPLIRTAQIYPVQTSGYIGVDDNKHHLYSFNIVIVIGG